MKIDQGRRMAVLGAGTMGHRIAELLAGYSVSVYDDVEQPFLDEGSDPHPSERSEALGKTSETLDLAQAVSRSDVVIEAVPQGICP